MSKEIDISQRSLAFSSPNHTTVSPLIPFWGDVTTVIIGSVQKLFYCDECQILPDINKVLLQSQNVPVCKVKYSQWVERHRANNAWFRHQVEEGKSSPSTTFWKLALEFIYILVRYHYNTFNMCCYVTNLSYLGL